MVIDRKRCARCRGWFPMDRDHFYRSGYLADGTTKFSCYCKPCSHAKTRARYALNGRPGDSGRAAYFREWRRNLRDTDPEGWAVYLARGRERKRQTPVHARDLPADFVSTAPLRDAMEQRGLSMTEVARRLGWLRSNGAADTGRLRATLNRATTRATRAKELVEAMGLDPLDVGL